MNTLKNALDRRGLTVLEASKMGAPYQTLRKHYRGERNIGEKSLLMYERILKIPRYELRPDLCPPPATPASPPAPESPGAAADAAARAKRRRGRPRRHPDGTPATGAGAEQGTSGAPGCDAGAA